MANIRLDKVKLEQNIPIPTYHCGGKNDWIALLLKMQVGDSFYLRAHPLRGRDLVTNVGARVLNAKRVIKKMHNQEIKTVLRRVHLGVRVWRTQ